MDFENSEALSDWSKWKETISKAVDIGEAVGFSQETIDNIALKLGNTLNAVVDPENREQRVLHELWKVGDDNDRKTIAKLVVNMVKTDDK